MLIYLVIFGFVLLRAVCTTCINDTNCKVCQLVITGFGPFTHAYLECSQCETNRQLDQDTGFCECMSGYYDYDDDVCKKCKSSCSTCDNGRNCTSCSEDDFRVLSKGACVCLQEYEEQEGTTVCKEKTDILMVILSAVGSVLCLIISAVVCVIIRYRRYSRVHTDRHENHRENEQNLQVQVYNANDLENTSSMFFNSKHEIFKDDEICSICLDKNTLFMTNCHHYFHGRCIFSWLDNKGTCPNCNEEIRGKDVRRWCQKCKKSLMPVVKNVVVTKIGKKKKDILKYTPVEHQICQDCDGKSSKSQSNDDPRMDVEGKTVALE